MSELAGYILAGGKSTRFGRDKARATLDGQPLLLRLARAMAEVTDGDVTVVADQLGKYDDLGLAGIVDQTAGAGPMAGLAAALADARARGRLWVLLASCDQLELKRAWVDQLWACRSAQGKAVAFRDQRWQPMPGLYHVSLYDLVERMIAKKELALWKLLDAAGADAVALPEDWPTIAQANTPADLSAYVRSRRGC